MENWQRDYTLLALLDLSILVSNLKLVTFSWRKLRYTCTPGSFSRGIIKIMRFSEKKKKSINQIYRPPENENASTFARKIVRYNDSADFLKSRSSSSRFITAWTHDQFHTETRTIFYRTKSIHHIA